MSGNQQMYLYQIKTIEIAITSKLAANSLTELRPLLGLFLTSAVVRDLFINTQIENIER